MGSSPVRWGRAVPTCELFDGRSCYKKSSTVDRIPDAVQFANNALGLGLAGGHWGTVVCPTARPGAIPSRTVLCTCNVWGPEWEEFLPCPLNLI